MKKLADFWRRDRGRGFAILAALVLLPAGIILSSTTLAETGVFVPAPITGSFPSGNQLNVTIKFNNDRTIRSPLSVTVTPSGNLQYLETSFDNDTVRSSQATVKSDGSIEITVNINESKRNAHSIGIATIALKAGESGQAELTLSQGRSSARGSSGRAADTQNGTYIIQPPAVAPAPAAPTAPPAAPASSPPAPVSKPAPAAKVSTPVVNSAPPMAAIPASEPKTVKTNDANVLPLLKKPSSSTAAHGKAAPQIGSATGATTRPPLVGFALGLLVLLVVLTALLIFRRHRPVDTPALTAEDAVIEDVWADVRRNAGTTLSTQSGLHTPPPNNNYLPVVSPPPAANALPILAPPVVSSPPASILAVPVPQPPTPPSMPPPEIQPAVPTAPPPSQPLPSVAVPIPYAKTAHPAPQNPLEAKIEETFYPLEKPQPPVSGIPAEEPLDMFEMAKRYPESFGNDLYNGPSASPPSNPPAKRPPKAK